MSYEVCSVTEGQRHGDTNAYSERGGIAPCIHRTSRRRWVDNAPASWEIPKSELGLEIRNPGWFYVVFLS